ncbi:penicillin-binding transpeptidase domain-containing protein, partial [Acinetobacter baumannii]
ARQIKLAPKGVDEEALVSINVKDGSVCAIVGGAGDYWKNQWNCATNVHTVGSAFKPFVYLTAFLENALDKDSPIDDEPLTVNQIDMTWTPKN